MALDTQLEQAASGLRYTEPGISMFGAARSTAAVMPEMLQLGQVMQMRAGMQQDAYRLRDMERAEKAGIAEADDFSAFSDAVTQTDGMSDVEQARHLKNFFTQRPSAATSPQVRDTMDVLAGSRSNVIQARKEESDLADLEFDQSTRREREEAARINATLSLKKAETERSSWQAQLDANEFKNADDLGAMLGRASGLDAQSQESLLALGSRFEGPGNEGLMKGLGSVVSGFAQADSLMESYKADLEPAAPLLARFGIKPGMDPTAMSKAFQTAYSAAQQADSRMGTRHTESLARAEALMAEMGETMNYVSTMRAKLSEELPQLLAASENPANREKTKEALRNWGLRSSKMAAITGSQLERRSLDMKRRQDEADLQKKFEDILNVKARTSLTKTREEDIRDGEQLRQWLPTDEASARLRVLSLLSDTDGFMKLSPDKQKEKIDGIMEGVVKPQSFRGVNSVPLRSGSGRGVDLGGAD